MDDDTVAECDNEALTVTSCAATTYAPFCKLAVHDTCARRPHSGSVALCRTQPSHLETVTQVDDGVLIINESPAQVTTGDGPTISVNGTFLVTFETSAIINGTKYGTRAKPLARNQASPCHLYST
ncbi:hypothetical protein AWZ03_015170 [Drosophila navojoa]|uniref:Uncharacterized protein n=1 Tax=Drosophila navojoa TaxID=7232 RepID=A0A484APG8_DRONA|nr:hypothetical protein AWZ03_015170 [Drosophila navojoa]